MTDKEKSELKELKKLRILKEIELSNINASIRRYELIVREEEIEKEADFDAWELAKQSIDDEYEISEKFKKKLLILDKSFWRKCLTEKDLSYDEEYLCIMQYHQIERANAEMGRSHGKGTFGYRLRDATEAEHQNMNFIEQRNFEAYLKKIKFAGYEQYEGVFQDGEGGWIFDELEDK